MGAIKAQSAVAKGRRLKAKAKNLVEAAQDDLKQVQGASAAQQKAILLRILERQLEILDYLQDRL